MFASVPRALRIPAFVLAAGLLDALVIGEVRPSDARSAGPTERSIQVLQHRIDDAKLDRVGIFVTETGPVGAGANRCVEVLLLNPSPPNVRYLRERFGRSVCVDAKPQTGYVESGTACGDGAPNGKTVTVPDIRGLAPHTAVRRLTAAGLGTCNAPDPKQPSRYVAENALRVTVQCPPAGNTVPAPAIVTFRSKGVLPGGYLFVARAEGDRPCN